MSHLVAKYDSLVESAGRDAKQAMKECEKRLKKTPHEPATVLFKGYLHTKQRQYAESLNVINSLSEIRPFINDIHFIRAIYKSWTKASRSLGGHPLTSPVLSTFLENLLKDAAPKRKKELLIHHFRISCSFELWEDALRAVAQLLKMAPEDPRLYFIQIMLRQLLSQVVDEDQLVLRKTHASLAFMLLTKCITQTNVTPAKSNLKVPSISSREQVRFLFQVLREQGRYEDMLLHVKLAKPSDENSDFRLIMPEIYAASKRYADLHDYCLSTIQERIKAHQEDGQNAVLGFAAVDWKLWEFYAQGLAHAQTTITDSNKSAYETAIENALHVAETASSHNSIHRSALLAALLCARRCRRDASSEEAEFGLSLSGLLQTYAKRHLSQSYFFDDVRRLVETLSFSSASAFTRYCRSLTKVSLPNLDESLQSRTAWSVCEVNCLKLDFLLNLSRIQQPPLNSIETFAANAMHLANTVGGLNMPSSFVEEEACIIVAAALIKLMHYHARAVKRAQTIADQRPLLQALLLLQHVLHRNAQNYLARIEHMKLSRELGLFSEAFHHYGKLGINEIQHDTLSHLAFDGIAMLHPFASNGPSVMTLNGVLADPYQGLARVIKWYSGAEERVSSFLAADTDDYRYDKMKEFIQFKTELASSLNRQLSLMERRRIARLTDRQYDETDLLDFHQGHWLSSASDTRDFSQYPNFFCAADPIANIGKELDPKALLARTTIEDFWHSVVLAKDPQLEWDLGHSRSERAAQTLQNYTENAPRQVLSNGPMLQGLGYVDDEGDLATFISMLKHDGLIDLTVNAQKGSTGTLSGSLARLHEKLKDLQACLNIRKKPMLESSLCILPHAFILRHVYANLEAIKFVLKLLDLILAQSKNNKHELYKKVDVRQLEEIRKESLCMAEEIRKFVEQWQARLDKDFVKEVAPKVFDGHLGKAVDKLVGRKMAESIFRTWKDSALDTLAGPLMLKIP